MKDKLKNIYTKILDKAKNLFPIWNKYKKYVITLGLFALVVVTLYFFTGEDYIARRMEVINSRPVSGEDYVPDKNFEINAHEDVNELIATYFEAYVNSDFEALSMIAQPLSEMEQTYIGVMTQYYEEFRNITCYTKRGLSKNSYIVSAYYEIKFVGIEEVAPSLVLFYVQTDKNGELYINNLYSDFNRRYRENVVNKDINTAFIKYTTQDDYIALHHEVDNAFKELILENEDIYILTKRTIPALRQEWEDTVYYVHEESESADDTKESQDTEETQGTESETGTDEPQTSQSEEPESQEPESQEPESQEPVVTYVKPTSDDVYVRSGPGTSYSKLGKVNKDEQFEKIGEENDWTKIKYKDKEGYIKSSYVKEVTE